MHQWGTKNDMVSQITAASDHAYKTHVPLVPRAYPKLFLGKDHIVVPDADLIAMEVSSRSTVTGPSKIHKYTRSTYYQARQWGL